jgi:hypothetical protein
VDPYHVGLSLGVYEMGRKCVREFWLFGLVVVVFLLSVAGSAPFLPQSW